MGEGYHIKSIVSSSGLPSASRAYLDPDDGSVLVFNKYVETALNILHNKTSTKSLIKSPLQ